MSPKKGLALLTVLLLVAAVFMACGGQKAPASQESATWSIAVEGADRAEFASTDYAQLDTVTVDAVLRTKDGSETAQTWEGVLLKDVLDAVGAKDYTSVTLEASDGYAKDYTPDLVNDSQTILGTVLNGEALTADEGYVEAVAASQPGNMWIKMLVKIKVNP